MALTYIQAIGIGFPLVGCHSVGTGSIYSNIVYDSGDPIPSQATLDAWITANGAAIVTQPTIQQVQSGVFGAASTNAIIPYGSSLPLITDGVQLFTFTFTPSSSSSKISLRIQFFIAHTATSQRFITGAIFRNSTCIRTAVIGNIVAVSGALATIVGNQAGNAIIELIDTPSTTSSVTYSFRIGSDSSSGTLYINQGVSQTLGGGQPSNGVYTLMEVL